MKKFFRALRMVHTEDLLAFSLLAVPLVPLVLALSQRNA